MNHLRSYNFFCVYFAINFLSMYISNISIDIYIVTFEFWWLYCSIGTENGNNLLFAISRRRSKSCLYAQPNVDNVAVCNQLCGMEINGKTSGECVYERFKDRKITSIIVNCFSKMCWFSNNKIGSASDEISKIKYLNLSF